MPDLRRIELHDQPHGDGERNESGDEASDQPTRPSHLVAKPGGDLGGQRIRSLAGKEHRRGDAAALVDA